jgi:hypothetical protein
MSSRRPILAALGVLLLGLTAAAHAQSTTPSQTKESGSPINDQGTNYNYRSNITQVAPSVPGLHLEVLEFADRLVLSNRTGKTVTVYGYQREPYARVLADGAVEVNEHSPAFYLNQSFYGDVNVPASASPTAKPDWALVDRTGQLEWHDHRIHWMSPELPPQVKNKAKRTKIFDWKVPIKVGAKLGVISGQLFWVPEEGTSTPLAAIIVLVVIVLAGFALVFFVRRRRRAGDPPASGSAGETTNRGPSGAREQANEAW